MCVNAEHLGAIFGLGIVLGVGHANPTNTLKFFVQHAVFCTRVLSYTRCGCVVVMSRFLIVGVARSHVLELRSHSTLDTSPVAAHID